MRALRPLLILAFVAGCGGSPFSGAPAPETPRQALAAAELAFLGAERTIRTMVLAGQIGPDDVQDVRRYRDAAYQSLQTLRASVAAGTADRALIVATDLAINALIVHLRSRSDVQNSLPPPPPKPAEFFGDVRYG